MAKKKKQNKRKDPIRYLWILCIELFVVLILLIIGGKMFPDNPISKSIASLTKSTPDVILDAGHGGYDSGSTYEDLQEKNITLALTLKIGEALENKGLVVEYTRESDEVLWATDELSDLTKRVELSNQSNAKAFISIHTNASDLGESIYGFEIWGKIKNEQTFDLAKRVMNQMDHLKYTQNRGIKDQDLTPLHVLEYNELPSILIETGFLANANDRSYLTRESGQQALANKIAQGIYEYIKAQESES